jgi:hypothetical protein
VEKQPTSLRGSDKKSAWSKAEEGVLVGARNLTIRYNRNGWHEKRTRKIRAALIATEDTAAS